MCHKRVTLTKYFICLTHNQIPFEASIFPGEGVDLLGGAGDRLLGPGGGGGQVQPPAHGSLQVIIMMLMIMMIMMLMIVMIMIIMIMIIMMMMMMMAARAV